MIKDQKADFTARFADAPDAVPNAAQVPVIAQMASRGSCRRFRAAPVPDDVLTTLCAAALSSPSKSDLQQRDIVLLKAPAQRTALAQLVGGQTWVADAPMLAVFCGNNRRQRLLHDMHDIPYANDHIDALFNAATDAAIALGAFVIAAEAAGLGTCPISAVRNKAQQVSDLLCLPRHVFPVAGLAVGYPASPPELSMRLPLAATVHVGCYDEDNIAEVVKTYDKARQTAQPIACQRSRDLFGVSKNYGWSEDKARQYSQPERADFGAFLRNRGFRFD